MEIRDKDGVKLALLLSMSEVSSGLTFFSENQEYLQVGAWNYPSGKVLQKHIHQRLLRTVERTQEFVFVVKGSLKAFIYDEHEEFVCDVVLSQSDGLILLAGGARLRNTYG